MSVYTPVGRDELAAWLRFFDVGELIDLAGIAAGVENSNYFLSTGGGRWVLTLFERLEETELDFYLRLMAHLASRDFPCPEPQEDNTGALWRSLAGKPGAVVTRLSGNCIETPDAVHCHAIGGILGKLHRLSADLAPSLPNPRGSSWREATGQRLLPLLPRSDHNLLADELAFQAAQDFSGLPRGIVHADLFRDNVLWQDDGTLSGVLDFYFAGEDCLLFDLAVAVNDWCFDEPGLQALLAGYTEERLLVPAELAAWPAMRRAAALRFWLSRLDDSHHPRPGEVVTIKDPAHFGKMLERLRLVDGSPAG